MITQEKAPAQVGTGIGGHSYNQPRHYSPNGLEALLSAAEKVRKTGEGQWLITCPAHDDGRPSTSVKELADGTILLHCFAGCTAAEIVQAAGLELADLFPDKGSYSPPKRRGERRIPYRDILKALSHEIHIAAVIAADIKEHRECDQATFDRLALAAARIADAQGGEL